MISPSLGAPGSGLGAGMFPGAGGANTAGMSPEEAMQMKMIQAVPETCAFKCAMSGVMGAALGAAFGIFTSAMRYDTPLSPTAPEVSSLPFRQQVKLGFQDLGRTAISSGRNFGIVGAVFAGSECCIEGFRGRNDIWNGIAAGAFTGGVLARNAGPKAVALGAGGFALFSVGIEWYLRMPESETRYPVE